MSRNTGASPETKEAVRVRDGYRCARCQEHTNPGEIQHRRARGMGGSRRTDTNQLPNLLLMCLPCHAWAERTNRPLARALGYACPSWQEPTQWPVRIGREWFLLQDDQALWVQEPHPEQAAELALLGEDVA